MFNILNWKQKILLSILQRRKHIWKFTYHVFFDDRNSCNGIRWIRDRGYLHRTLINHVCNYFTWITVSNFFVNYYYDKGLKQITKYFKICLKLFWGINYGGLRNEWFVFVLRFKTVGPALWSDVIKSIKLYFFCLFSWIYHTSGREEWYLWKIQKSFRRKWCRVCCKKMRQQWSNPFLKLSP